MWYVNIDGIDDDYLEFCGYSCVAENDEFKIYRDYYGTEQIVYKARPLLAVHDINDRDAILRRARTKEAIAAPRKPPN